MNELYSKKFKSSAKHRIESLWHIIENIVKLHFPFVLVNKNTCNALQ